MAVIQISRIQHRRGLEQDFPQLASAELGWTIDTRRLFIGNGTELEGAPTPGVTEILTEYSDILSLVNTFQYKNLDAGFEAITGPDYSSPIVRTLQNKVDDFTSVKDFGAIGDGVADDTEPFRRAFHNARAGKLPSGINPRHRAIYIPAGNYRITDTIKIPPYTMIIGEGKDTSIVEGAFAGPLFQLEDSATQVGASFGASSAVVTEYHFRDFQLFQKIATFDQPALQIDGGNAITFNRVFFKGLISDLVGTNMNDGRAGCYMSGASSSVETFDVKFEQCEFSNIGYGIQALLESHDIVINACTFKDVYRGVVLGETGQTNTSKPYSIVVSNNIFKNVAFQGLYCHDYIYNVTSKGNMYTITSRNSSSPTATIVSSAITFAANNNSSIGDIFGWTDSNNDYLNHQPVATSTYRCYVVDKDYGIQSGKLFDVHAYQITLANTASFSSAALFTLPRANVSYQENVEVSYKVSHSGNVRTGKMYVVKTGGGIGWHEEYLETGNTDFTFNANISTGDVEYISSATAEPAELTYSIRYFNET
jgi:hypothetical protein